MLDNIYNILNLGTIVFSILYLISITVDTTKKDYNNVKNLKIRIVLSSIECILFILKIVVLIVSQKFGFLLGSAIFCAILWALNTVWIFSSLKRAQNDQNLPNIEFHIIFDSYYDESKIVEADGYEIIENDKNSKEITSFENIK